MAIIIGGIIESGNGAGDHPVLMLPRNYRKDSGKIPVMFFPGTGSNWLTAYQRGVTYDLMEKVADAGFPIMTSDLGVDPFGNARARAGIDGMIAWATGIKVGLAVTTKFHLAGFSQGAVNALSWGGNNISKVQTFTGFAPLTDLNVVANSADAGLRGFTDRAYPSAYSESRDGAVNNPQTMATAGRYNNIPMTLCYSSNDNVVPNSSTTQFKNSVGTSATLVNLGPIGHDNGVPNAPASINALLARIGA